MATPIILDVDTGIDDAVAMMLAVSSRRMDIKAVTTTFGNSNVNMTTLNTLKVLELLGAVNIPVAHGAAKGILSPMKAAQRGRPALGTDGMLGMSDALPYPGRSPDEQGACALMEKVVKEADSKAIIVCMGPLTNAAIFLLAHPECRDMLSGIVVTGGSSDRGDVLPTVEFNMASDPEAAHIVFSSGVRIMMCGLDVTEKAYLTFDEREKIKLRGGRLADFLYPPLRKLGEYEEETLLKDGCPIRDPVSVAWLLNPSIFKSEPCRVSIDLTGRYTRGTTICEPYRKGGPYPNALIATGIDRDAYVSMITEAFASYAGSVTDF
ncbi:MAG: nucleoside hydrolase [Oscillospiraceae bacterium]|jgi:pyrimidine-specific ribonucleoside hydrolase